MAIGDILKGIGSGIGKVASGIGDAVGDVAGFLGGAVGDGLESLAENVKIVQDNLGRLGRFDDEPNGIISKGLDKAIKDFQRDSGLKVDGKLYPGGETERSIFGQLTGRDPNDIWQIEENPGPSGFGGFPTTVPTERPGPGGFLGALKTIGEAIEDSGLSTTVDESPDTTSWSERIAQRRAAGGTLFGTDVGTGSLLPEDEPNDLSRYNLDAGDVAQGLGTLIGGIGQGLSWGFDKIGDIFDGDDEAAPLPPEMPEEVKQRRAQNEAVDDLKAGAWQAVDRTGVIDAGAGAVGVISPGLGDAAKDAAAKADRFALSKKPPLVWEDKGARGVEFGNDRQIIRETKQHEGSVGHPYKDTEGHITVGVGHMIPDVEAAKRLPFRVPETPLPAGFEGPPSPERLATKKEIEAMFSQVGSIKQTGNLSSGAFSPGNNPNMKGLFLRESDVDKLLRDDLQTHANEMRRIWTGVETYPKEVQQSMLDLQYNIGGGAGGFRPSKWPRLKAALDRRDWAGAAHEMNRPQVSQDRNEITKTRIWDKHKPTEAQKQAWGV